MKVGVDFVSQNLCRYYLSLAHIASLFPGMIWVQRISSFSDLCSTAILRSVNGALAIVCSILIYEIITQLKPALDRRKAALNTVVLSLYPLHWFFTYLYYTDVASLTVFLAMYLTSLKKNYFLSALVWTVSICILNTFFPVHEIRQMIILFNLFHADGGIGCMHSTNQYHMDAFCCM